MVFELVPTLFESLVMTNVRVECDSGPSKFSTFLPLVEKMVNSFEVMNETKNLGLYTQCQRQKELILLSKH